MIVDDHPVVLAGLAAIVGAQHGMNVVAQSRDGGNAVELAQAANVDVALVDLHLGDVSGWDVLARLKAAGIGGLLAISSLQGDEDLHRAVTAGAKGFIAKDADAEEIADAIQTVARGLRYFPAWTGTVLARRSEFQELSSRELEILEHMGRGLSNKEIGEALGIGESTVKQHVGNVLSKLGVQDRTGAVLRGLERGLIGRR
jgi:DNA-binding NarL/FixJ family response regulator